MKEEREGVNITNILWAHFGKLFCTFSLRLKTFGVRKSAKKAACKMLVKLTKDLLKNWRLWSSVLWQRHLVVITKSKQSIGCVWPLLWPHWLSIKVFLLFSIESQCIMLHFKIYANMSNTIFFCLLSNYKFIGCDIVITGNGLNMLRKIKVFSIKNV
jgi:hypothetical protein